MNNTNYIYRSRQGIRLIFLLILHENMLWVTQKPLAKALLMSTHNICFCREIKKIFIPLNWKNSMQTHHHHKNYNIFTICNKHLKHDNICHYIWTSPHKYLQMCLKIAGWVANCVDSYQKLHSVAFQSWSTLFTKCSGLSVQILGISMVHTIKVLSSAIA